MAENRFGIFGGTFNPIHMGHLIVAEDVRAKFSLSKIIFVPANIPPHKSTKDLASSEDRLLMVKMAVEGNPYFEVSEVEVLRGGRSYTCDTLGILRESLEGELFFILGGEAFLNFHTWRNPIGVLEKANFIVMSRPFSGVSVYEIENYLIDLEEMLNSFSYIESAYLEERNGEKICEFKVLANGIERSIFFAEVVSVAISSTMVRKRIKKGQSVRYLVPEKVYNYIVERGLYVR